MLNNLSSHAQVDTEQRDGDAYITLRNANGKSINGKPSVQITKKRAARLLRERRAIATDDPSEILLLPKSAIRIRKKKLEAEFDPRAWLSLAEKKLETARAEYDKENFGFALSALQGVEERAAKSILLQIGIIASDDSELLLFLKSFVNKKYYQTPKALSHDWHRKILSDVDDWLVVLHAIWASEGRVLPGWRPSTGVAHFVDTLRVPIHKVLKLKSNYSPSIKELTETILGCNNILDMATEALKETNKASKVTFPLRKDIHPALAKFLKWLGLSYKRELDISYLEKAKIREMKPKWSQSRWNQIYKSTLTMVYVLITLAVLNVFLSEYHIFGEYPTSKIEYSRSLPMIAKFSDVHNLLLRTLQMIGPYISLLSMDGHQSKK